MRLLETNELDYWFITCRHHLSYEIAVFSFVPQFLLHLCTKFVLLNAVESKFRGFNRVTFADATVELLEQEGFPAFL